MILQFAKTNNNKITRNDTMQLLKITDSQAYRLLKKLADNDKLELIGKGKYSYYKIKSHQCK
jgi:predicted HTH transcriptional regulator